MRFLEKSTLPIATRQDAVFEVKSFEVDGQSHYSNPIFLRFR
jgi:hypothetical protein